MGIDISLSGAGLFIMYEFIHIVKENVLTWRILFRCGGAAEWSLAATKERPFRRNSAALPQRKPALSHPA